MLAVVLVYQQVENNVITPKVQGKAVHLSAFFIIVSVTLFGALLGVLGALTAVPLAAMIQIFVQEVTKARREQVAAANAALEPASQTPACESDAACLCAALSAYGVGGSEGSDRRSGAAAAPQQRNDRPRTTTRTEDPQALELLRAKLDVPPPRPGLVERTVLVAASPATAAVASSASSRPLVTARRRSSRSGRRATVANSPGSRSTTATTIPSSF